MPRTFFQPIPLLQIVDAQYARLAPCVAMVRAMARSTNYTIIFLYKIAPFHSVATEAVS